MAQQKDSGQQLVNLILIGVGAWLVWEFILSPLLASQQTGAAVGPICYDQNGNAFQCPPGVAAGTVLNMGTVAAQSNTTCFDMHGNAIACPPGIQPGTTLNTSIPQNPPVQTPTTQNNTKTSIVTTGSPVQQLTQAALARRKAQAQVAANQPARSTQTGMKGIVPAFPAGGGPAFSHFVPGGMTFGTGSSAFGNPPVPYFNPLSKMVQ